MCYRASESIQVGIARREAKMAEARGVRGFSGRIPRLGSGGWTHSFFIIGLEGLAVAILGLYMLLFPDNARDHIRLIAGLVLIVTGCYQLQRGFTFYHANTHRNVVPIRFTGGAVMLFGGILIVLERLSAHFSPTSAQVVLAATLLAAGIFGLLAGLLGWREGDLRLANIIASVALIVLAGFLVSEIRSGNDKTQLLGIIVLILGLALLGYAYLLRQHRLDEAPLAETTTYYSPPAPNGGQQTADDGDQTADGG